MNSSQGLPPLGIEPFQYPLCRIVGVNLHTVEMPVVELHFQYPLCRIVGVNPETVRTVAENQVLSVSALSDRWCEQVPAAMSSSVAAFSIRSVGSLV